MGFYICYVKLGQVAMQNQTAVFVHSEWNESTSLDEMNNKPKSFQTKDNRSRFSNYIIISDWI